MPYIYEYRSLHFGRKREAAERGDENNGLGQLDALFGMVHSIDHHVDDNDGIGHGYVDGITFI